MAGVKHVNFAGAFKWDAAFGYGKAEVGLYWGLRAAGVDVTLLGEAADNVFINQVKLVERGRTPQLAPITIVSYVPDWWNRFFPANLTRRWLFTMNESTKAARRMVSQINKNCERLLVTCEDQAKVYRESGVTIPITVIGMGVDYNVPRYERRRLPEAGETFHFLTYSYGDMRKGAEKALVAFKKLFDGDPRYHITVKAREGLDTWLECIEDPQLTVRFGMLHERQWQTMLRESHCFLFPSRGEGFGYPPREAVLSGLPTIATRWMGMHDVDCWGMGRDVKELRRVPDGNHANADDALWSEPETEHLVKLMQRVVDNYEGACDLVDRGRDYLLNENTFKKMGERVAAVL